jgi:hypothetical protein
MSTKRPLNEGFIRHQVKGGTITQQSKPAVKPIAPPPAPKPPKK